MGGFLLLARHFFGRFFDNDIVSQDADMRTNAVQTLGFVAVPGMFAAFSMLPTGVRFDQPFAHGWEFIVDYYFFVLYSMIAMGFVMVFEWDALFPDRRDYLVLTPLPLGGGAIFFAKIAALVAFLGMFILDANFFGALLAPLITGSAGFTWTWSMIFRIAAAHAIACLAGGAFVAMAFAALQGVLINCLTGRAFRRVSPWAQMASMALLITILFLTPFLAGAIRPLFEQRSPLLRWFPPFWFLALFMEMLPGKPAGTMFQDLAPLAPRALWIAAALFALTYLAGYRRHTRRVLESIEKSSDPPGRIRVWLERFANRRLLPHPLQRATFHFITNTILRSARHRLFLATLGGVAVALTLPNIFWLGLRPGGPMFVWSPAGLVAVPLILTYLCVTGLRAAFNLPAELRANWIFQTAESEDRVQHLRAARKWIVAMGLAPLIAILAPAEIAWRGWAGLVSLAVPLALSLVMLNVLLIWFRKIPFTCSYFPGKTSMAGMAGVFVITFYVYVFTMSRMELRWISAPLGLLPYFALCGAALYGLRLLEGRELRIDDVFIYEDQPEPVVRSLELG
jgi:hypothetical protein